jgi:hypothetical protein
MWTNILLLSGGLKAVPTINDLRFTIYDLLFLWQIHLPD